MVSRKRAIVVSGLTTRTLEPSEPPEPPEPFVPSAELPAALEEAIFLAEETGDTADDLAALQQAKAYLQGQLAQATTAEQRLPIRRAIRELDSRIRELGPDRDADLQAQLAQANLRAQVAQRGFEFGEAFVRSAGLPGIPGGGSPTVVFQSLIPDAEQIRRATDAIIYGAGSQAFVGSSRLVPGV
jgi:hypothetical protein